VFQFSVAGRELGFAEVLPDARDTARLITGLKDRRTRDFALACDDQRAAHRLWQHLARRCVTPPRGLRTAAADALQVDQLAARRHPHGPGRIPHREKAAAIFRQAAEEEGY
jgi:hypothetical protein